MTNIFYFNKLENIYTFCNKSSFYLQTELNIRGHSGNIIDLYKFSLYFSPFKTLA